MSDEIIQNDRLLDLEGSVRDIAVKTGVIEAKQEHLLSKIEEGFLGLQESHRLVSAKQEALESRIEPIEASVASSTRNWGIAKKLIIPAISATAGIFGVKFGNGLFEMVSKLFP